MALKPESEEVFTYSEDVSPGSFYDPSEKEYSPGDKMHTIKTETCKPYYKIEILSKDLSSLKNSEVMKKEPWIKDFDTQKEGSYFILLEGQKICERKGDIQPYPTQHVVSSVYYKSFIQMLICFSHEIEDKNLEELENYITSVIRMKDKNIDFKRYQPDTDVAIVPDKIFHSFSKAYIYQKGKATSISSIKHGLEEFCHYLTHTQTSKLPVSCNVLKPLTTTVVKNESTTGTRKKTFFIYLSTELEQCASRLSGVCEAGNATAIMKPSQGSELAATHNSQNSKRKCNSSTPMSQQNVALVREQEQCKNTCERIYDQSVRKKEFLSEQSHQQQNSGHQQPTHQGSTGKSFCHKGSRVHRPSEVSQAEDHKQYSRNPSCSQPTKKSCSQSTKYSEYVENISQINDECCKNDQSGSMEFADFTVQNQASKKMDQVESKCIHSVHGDVITAEKRESSMQNSPLKPAHESSNTHERCEEPRSLSESKSNKADPLSTLLMPSKEFEVCGMTRKYYGVHSEVEGKTIILLGASGSGKTTLVNFIANYHSGIKVADDKLVYAARSSNDTEGHTTQITGYTFCTGEDDTPITIIDTPGLNDSSGAEVQDHVQSLKTFLANIGSQNIKIHAIGFVAQAHLVRLTSSERLVMDYVSSLFGKEVGNHVISFVTFSDNQEVPPVVEAIKNYGVTCSAFLKFNNSALSSSKEEEIDELDRIYWRIGCKSWKKCLKLIDKLPSLSFKSLQNEIYVSQFMETAEKNLKTEIVNFVNRHSRNNCPTTEMFSNAKKIWTLAEVVKELKCVSMSDCPNVDNILIRYVYDVCKEINCHQSSRECVKLLSLSPSKPLLKAGLGIVSSVAPIYNTVKQIIAQSHKQRQQVFSYALFCHECDKDHVLERTKEHRFKYWRSKEIAYKCTVCPCEGGVHGEKGEKDENRNQSTAELGGFTPANLLHHTKNCIEVVLKDMCLPEHKIHEDEYIKHLKYFTKREGQQLCIDLLAMTS